MRLPQLGEVVRLRQGARAGGASENVTKAELRICTKGQAFMVWINGALAATGQDCDLKFTNETLNAPCNRPLTVRRGRITLSYFIMQP